MKSWKKAAAPRFWSSTTNARSSTRNCADIARTITAVRITEIAYDGQSFKAPELPKKEAEGEEGRAVEVESTQSRGEGGRRAGKESSSQENSSEKVGAEEKKYGGSASRERSAEHSPILDQATRNWKLISMAHKKGLGSSRNGRDSNAQRLGFKAFGGQLVPGGTIIVRQRGTA